MNEVKRPRKPLIYYYAVVIMVLSLFNFMAMPWLMEQRVQEVDYGTFMTMTDTSSVQPVSFAYSATASARLSAE